MSEAEAQAFEEYCLANPDFASQVEYEQRLKAGIAAGGARFHRRIRALPTIRCAGSLAAAAGVLLALVGDCSTRGIAWCRTHTPSLMAAVTSDDQRDGAVTCVSRWCAAARPYRALPAGLVRVEIVGLFDPGFHYSRRARSSRTRTRTSIPSPRFMVSIPASPTSLEVMIDSDQLRPGTYSLRVRKQATGEDSLDFELRQVLTAVSRLDASSQKASCDPWY